MAFEYRGARLPATARSKQRYLNNVIGCAAATYQWGIRMEQTTSGPPGTRRFIVVGQVRNQSKYFPLPFEKQTGNAVKEDEEEGQEAGS